MTAARLLLATAAAALLPAAGRAQPKGFPANPDAPPPAISYEGTEVFRYLLLRGGLKPYTETELDQFGVRGGLGLDFSDTVVVVVGSHSRGVAGGRTVVGWLGQVVKQGGAALVAENFNTAFGTPMFEQRLLTITGTRVVGGRENRVYAGRSAAPFPDPVPPPAFAGAEPEWRIMGGDRPLTRVATLDASIISFPIAPPPWCEVLARFPPGCRDATTNQWLAANGAGFVAGGRGGQGFNQRPFRFLAVADPGVFCNGLLVGSDENGPTDNLEFADRAVKFLTAVDGADRKRARCLFVEHGRVVSNFDELGQKFRPPLPPLPIPPWDQLQPKLVDLGNKVIDQVQQKDIPNKLLVGPEPEHPHSRLRYLLAAALVMASLWAGFGLIRRVWGARQPGDIPTPPPDGRPPAPADGTPPGVFGRRGRELAARDNVLEPARAACRALFDEAAAPDGTGPKLPPVVISDVVTKPGTLGKALADLWAVAYGRPVPLPATKWAVLEPLLVRARAAFAAGKWRFVDRPRGVA